MTEPQPCWDIPEDVALAELAAAPGARWPESTVGVTAEAVFYPPADRSTQWFSGTYPGSPFGPIIEKIVLHTTETGTWPGYAGGASAPNLTYDPRSHRWRQHFRLDRSARALRDPSSTLVRENRDNVAQIEIICTCDAAFARKYGYLHVTQLDDRALRDLGAFIRFMHDHWGTPLTAATIWLPYPSSYGNTTARMSGPTYDAYRGVLGHMHCSGNVHGDPGTINIARIMAYARGTTPQPQEVDDVTPQEMLAAKISSGDARVNGWTLGHLLEWQARMALSQQAATAALAKAVAALAAGQTLAQADLDDIQATLAEEPPPLPPVPS